MSHKGPIGPSAFPIKKPEVKTGRIGTPRKNTLLLAAITVTLLSKNAEVKK